MNKDNKKWAINYLKYHTRNFKLLIAHHWLSDFFLFPIFTCLLFHDLDLMRFKMIISRIYPINAEYIPSMYLSCVNVILHYSIIHFLILFDRPIK